MALSYKDKNTEWNDNLSGNTSDLSDPGPGVLTVSSNRKAAISATDQSESSIISSRYQVQCGDKVLAPATKETHTAGGGQLSAPTVGSLSVSSAFSCALLAAVTSSCQVQSHQVRTQAG